ncbi:MAG: DNA-3-methyladenine glycosylase I [Candidatus Eremiobacteraeota bacterium]|nr:DNA-3-methyladenine glycosylase I [Candidatus Eremiobacteraeota bacterium]
MATPRMRRPQAPADYLNIISRAVFSAGLSWKFIDDRWERFEEVFEGFDVVKVASFDGATIDRIAETPGLLRSRKKVAATVNNARALLAIEAEHGSIRSWLDAFPSYAAAAADVGKRFKYLGKTFGAYYLLYIAGAKVPDFPTFEEWSKATGEVHPRMRELVAANENREVGALPKRMPRRR